MKKITMVLITLLIMGVVLTAGCVDEQSSSDDVSDSSSDDSTIIVGVSIVPQQEFVEKIAGDNVEVVVMVPPGASPHSYEPTPSQLTALSNAKMYAMVGSGITVEDTMIDKLADLNSDMLIVDCSEGITLTEMAAHSHDEEEEHDHEGETEEEEEHDHEAETEEEEHDHEADEEEHDHGEESLDPHIWTSPDNVEIMVENIYQGLVEVDPANQETYLANKNAYLAELHELDEQIQSTLEGKEGSSFMVYHPAWGYFARHYGITQVAVEIEGKEPSVQDMQSVIDLANEEGIKVIFVQSGFSTVSAEAIASEIDGEVVEVDPLAKDYIDNLAKVAEAFEKGLA
jgi:zinc transport system substrate-binding protein